MSNRRDTGPEMASTKRHDLDQRDWEIIELLRAGTISNSAVAKELGVSEGMIRQRIKRLRELGILSLRGLINPEILANRQVVWLGVNVTESRLLDQKAAEISQLDDVLSVSIVSGRFDMVVELLLDSHHGLVDFLINELARIDGITRTESFVTLKTYSKFV
jgi:Lrp/AsnC family transcriptional regulator for asnA, asnC and gidA